jgi:hypothetical protein
MDEVGRLIPQAAEQVLKPCIAVKPTSRLALFGPVVAKRHPLE